jgi:hypothetical protein
LQWFKIVLSFLSSKLRLYVKNNNKNIVDDEIRNYTRNFIQQLLELLSLGMIARISDSIASKELKLTYKEIMENNRNSTYTLVNLFINLEWLNNFPAKNIVEIANNLEEEDNNFTLDILTLMVSNYFYLHHCPDFRKKQAVCEKLGIKYETVINEIMA